MVIKEAFPLNIPTLFAVFCSMKNIFENIVNRVRENIWPAGSKKPIPVKVPSRNQPHPAEVRGGSRNYPPNR